MWAASQQNLQSNILQFSAETGSTHSWQWSAELHGHMQTTEKVGLIIQEFPWKDGLQA